MQFLLRACCRSFPKRRKELPQLKMSFHNWRHVMPLNHDLLPIEGGGSGMPFKRSWILFLSKTPSGEGGACSYEEKRRLPILSMICFDQLSKISSTNGENFDYASFSSIPLLPVPFCLSYHLEYSFSIRNIGAVSI